MATIAVFVALGGTSYAAIKVTSRNVPKDALTGADVKNLTGKDVRNNSLTGADVKRLGTGDVTDGSLLATDFRAGELPAPFAAGSYYDRTQSDARFQAQPVCPAGTLFHEGTCIETLRRDQDGFRDAETTCNAAGNRRLPSPEELLGFRHRPGVGVTATYEWATGLSFEAGPPAVVYANLVNNAASGSNLGDLPTPRPFRCAVAPG